MLGHVYRLWPKGRGRARADGIDLGHADRVLRRSPDRRLQRAHETARSLGLAVWLIRRRTLELAALHARDVRPPKSVRASIWHADEPRASLRGTLRLRLPR